ncbi:hypothetical protein [Streptomyces sp. LN549]|uniref:hypothetical protein n=1 Tax=Streptomyces sp. LN549 TaxID=3112979 RepID=UPI003718BFBF
MSGVSGRGGRGGGSGPGPEPGAEVVLLRLFGGRLRIGPARADGWPGIEVDGPSAEVLASQPAGLGARVEVFGPEGTRARLAEPAAEPAAVCGTP